MFRGSNLRASPTMQWLAHTATDDKFNTAENRVWRTSRFYTLPFSSVSPDENRCMVAGDPHFRTFDGATIQFQGVCSYTLARPDPNLRGSLTDFNVVIKNEHRDGNNRASWAKHVSVDVYGSTIRLDRDGQVFVSSWYRIRSLYTLIFEILFCE